MPTPYAQRQRPPVLVPCRGLTSPKPVASRTASVKEPVTPASVLTFARAECVLGHGPMIATVRSAHGKHRLDSPYQSHRVHEINNLLKCHLWHSSVEPHGVHDAFDIPDCETKPPPGPLLPLREHVSRQPAKFLGPILRSHIAISLEHPVFGATIPSSDDNAAMRQSQSLPTKLLAVRVRNQPMRRAHTVSSYQRNMMLHDRYIRDRMDIGRRES